MKKFIKTLFVFIVYLSLLPQSASANAPIPEYGKARGTIDIPCVLPPPAWRYPGEKEGAMITHTITIDFWNVGKAGGDQYEYVAVTTEYSGKNSSCSRGGTHGDKFDGGPNGKFQAFGRMVNGKYIEVTWNGGTSNIPVLTPEVFSKYNWGGFEPEKIPTIEGGEYQVETFGSTRFNGLYGQVEFIIPNPDGTYDEESWNLAKIDMELPPGTRLKVSEKSGLQLALPNQTTINVGPETEIVLVSVDPRKGVMQLLYGELKANVTKMMKDGSMQVVMSQAVAGIKGTIFVLEETGDTSTLKVIEGTVALKSKTSGQEEKVNVGEALVADQNGLGQKTTFDVNAENADWKNFEDNFGKINTGSKKYLYYLGIPILLVVVVAIFFVIKRRKSKV